MTGETALETALETTARLFFRELDPAEAARISADALSGSEDGELFLEYRESEVTSLEDGRIRSASFDTTRGFGLRAVRGAAAAYAHAGEITGPALRRAAEAVRGLPGERAIRVSEPPRATNARLYDAANPLGAMDFPAKAALLAEMDAYARGRDPRVVQVMASPVRRVAGGADHAP
jgi:TldD protein